jgi:hypothetical protein
MTPELDEDVEDLLQAWDAGAYHDEVSASSSSSARGEWGSILSCSHCPKRWLRSRRS